MNTGRRASLYTRHRYPHERIDSASLYMSCLSASLAPSGLHRSTRPSPTPRSAFIWSAQLGRVIAASPLDRHIEVADVEVVVGMQLGRGEAELLGGVAMRAVRAGAIPLLPPEHRALNRCIPLEPESLVDAPQRAHGIGGELAMMHV